MAAAEWLWKQLNGAVYEYTCKSNLNGFAGSLWPVSARVGVGGEVYDNTISSLTKRIRSKYLQR